MIHFYPGAASILVAFMFSPAAVRTFQLKLHRRELRNKSVKYASLLLQLKLHLNICSLFLSVPLSECLLTLDVEYSLYMLCVCTT